MTGPYACAVSALLCPVDDDVLVTPGKYTETKVTGQVLPTVYLFSLCDVASELDHQTWRWNASFTETMSYSGWGMLVAECTCIPKPKTPSNNECCKIFMTPPLCIPACPQ